VAGAREQSLLRCSTPAGLWPRDSDLPPLTLGAVRVRLACAGVRAVFLALSVPLQPAAPVPRAEARRDPATSRLLLGPQEARAESNLKSRSGGRQLPAGSRA
jgi:hypothetical protein